jgi:hypothetical protein
MLLGDVHDRLPRFEQGVYCIDRRRWRENEFKLPECRLRMELLDMDSDLSQRANNLLDHGESTSGIRSQI